MRIAIFTICRSAKIEHGRLNISEAYGGLALERVPARAELTLATRLFFSSEEEGSFSGAMRIVDPDGKQLAESPILIDVPIPVEDATGIYIDSVGGISVTIRTFGEYQFQFIQPKADPIKFPLYVTKRGNK